MKKHHWNVSYQMQKKTVVWDFNTMTITDADIFITLFKYAWKNTIEMFLTKCRKKLLIEILINWPLLMLIFLQRYINTHEKTPLKCFLPNAEKTVDWDLFFSFLLKPFDSSGDNFLLMHQLIERWGRKHHFEGRCYFKAS